MIDRDDTYFAASMLAVGAFWLFAVIGIVMVAS